MKRLFAIAALVVGLGVAPSVEAAASPITLVSRQAIDSRLEEVTLATPALAAPTKVRVMLPNGYDPNGSQRYPVLYLLHGGFGSYRDWTGGDDVRRLTENLGLIVVMPDGGRGGWYSDWDNFGRGGPPRWRTYHVDQLISWIDANYATVASRSGRAVAGLSMGGFGAVSYAAGRPDLFAAVASFSGAVDLRGLPVRLLISVSPLIDGGQPGAIFGVPGLDWNKMAARNPWHLAANLRGMHVALYTGNGSPGPLDGPNTEPIDPQEFEVHNMNVALHQRLDALGIGHTWGDYGNGTHRWPYWVRDLAWELPALSASIGVVPSR